MKDIKSSLKRFLVLGSSADDVMEQLAGMGISFGDPPVDSCIIAVLELEPCASDPLTISKSVFRREESAIHVSGSDNERDRSMV